MSSVYEPKEEMHQIEAVLYENHLQGGPGTYIAKNTRDKTVNVEAICASMKNRGGYEGSFEDAVKTVNHFFKEAMYQLCDGFSVSTGWFTISVRIGGLFHSAKEAFDPKKHRVSFAFRTLKAMRNLTSLIGITISGHVEESAYIIGFNDMEAPVSGNMFEPGHASEVVGRRIKIEGPAAETGLWLAPVLDPSKRVKMTRILSNTASRIQFIPAPTGYSENRLEIRTRYSGTATPLATPRTIASPFTLTEV